LAAGAFLVATPLLAAAAPFPFLTAPPCPAAALPFLAWAPFLAWVPFLAALPFLAWVPFLAALPFLAWVPLRAFRARLDFEAVIRASPPVGSRLLYAVLCGQAGGLSRDRHLRQSVPCRSRDRPERWLPAS
jgi:hypothetical protein